MGLRCLQDPIKEKLAEIVTDFHKDIETTQNVNSQYKLYIIVIYIYCSTLGYVYPCIIIAFYRYRVVVLLYPYNILHN